jgi:hypothetical protein
MKKLLIVVYFLFCSIANQCADERPHMGSKSYNVQCTLQSERYDNLTANGHSTFIDVKANDVKINGYCNATTCDLGKVNANGEISIEGSKITEINANGCCRIKDSKIDTIKTHGTLCAFKSTLGRVTASGNFCKFAGSYIRSLGARSSNSASGIFINGYCIMNQNDMGNQPEITLHDNCTLAENITFEKPGGKVICTGRPSQIRPQQVINGTLIRPLWHKQISGISKFSGIVYLQTLMPAYRSEQPPAYDAQDFDAAPGEQQEPPPPYSD